MMPFFQSRCEFQSPDPGDGFKITYGAPSARAAIGLTRRNLHILVPLLPEPLKGPARKWLEGGYAADLRSLSAGARADHISRDPSGVLQWTAGMIDPPAQEASWLG